MNNRIALVILLVAGCGARTPLSLDDGDGGAPTDSRDGDAPTDRIPGLAGACASAIENQPCSVNADVVCERLTSIDPHCNYILGCIENRWQPLNRSLECFDFAEATSCPAEPPEPTRCTEDHKYCFYPRGLGCRCLGGYWTCSSGTCALPRPALGSACSKDRPACTYGACDDVWGFRMGQRCFQGTWRLVSRAVCR